MNKNLFKYVLNLVELIMRLYFVISNIFLPFALNYYYSESKSNFKKWNLNHNSNLSCRTVSWFFRSKISLKTPTLTPLPILINVFQTNNLSQALINKSPNSIHSWLMWIKSSSIKFMSTLWWILRLVRK